jgi:hypothetical protein
MKIKAIVLSLMALFAGGSAWAQIGHLPASSQIAQAMETIEPEHRANQFMENLVLNLQSDNNGVVESTLRLVADLKVKNPDLQFFSLRKYVSGLQTTGSTSALRYMAYLTMSTLEYPQWFSKRNFGGEPNEFWLNLGQRAHERLVVFGVVK